MGDVQREAERGWDRAKDSMKSPTGVLTGGIINPQNYTSTGSKLNKGLDDTIFGIDPDEDKTYEAIKAPDAEKLTGMTQEELGARNIELNEKIDDMVNQPSLGANRLKAAGSAQMAQLRAQQGQSGVTGGRAISQQIQAQRGIDRDVAERSQSDYNSAIDRMTGKQKSDAGTFVNLEAAKNALRLAQDRDTSGGLLSSILG